MAHSEKLQGKVKNVPFSPHDNYDADVGGSIDHDKFLFKRGNEAVHVNLTHPVHEQEGEDSSVSYPHNVDTIYHGNDTYSYQHHFWPKPLGRTSPPIVSGLWSTEGAKSDVATALGVVARHSMEKFGQLPRADRELSPHSLPIAQRVMGAIEQHGIEGAADTYVPSVARVNFGGAERTRVSNETRNIVDKAFAIGPKQYGSDDLEDIAPKQLAQGSKMVRGLFAGRHLNKQQWHQQEFDF